MESNSLINSQPTNSPLSDGDMSLTHFSEWSRADKMAFINLVFFGFLGVISALIAFISILSARRLERMERDGLRMQASGIVNRVTPTDDNHQEN